MNAALLFIEAYVRLLRHDRFLRKRDFAALYRDLRAFPCAPLPSAPPSLADVCHALDLACTLYRKQVLCLQRSDVLVRMLRRRGIPARMMIGAQKLPFKAHAWVEVDGVILHDRLASSERFLVMEVC